jgi:hypothetical protein
VDHVAGRVEGDDRRCGAATDRNRGIELGAFLIVVQGRAAAMNDPDIVLVVDRDADRHAEQRFVGERLRPQRIDLKDRGFHHRVLGGRGVLQHPRAGAEADYSRRQRDAAQKIPLLHRLDHSLPPSLFVQYGHEALLQSIFATRTPPSSASASSASAFIRRAWRAPSNHRP